LMSAVQRHSELEIASMVTKTTNANDHLGRRRLIHRMGTRSIIHVQR